MSSTCWTNRLTLAYVPLLKEPVRHHLLQCAWRTRADQPDTSTGLELHVVGAAAEQPRVLVAAGDAGPSSLPVDIQQDVLVIAKVVAVADGLFELLHCELLGGVAGLHLV